MSTVTAALLGAVILGVLQLAVMGVVFLVHEARQRRSRLKVMAALEQEYRKQHQRPPAPPPLPEATVQRAGMTDPPYFNGGVFSWLPRDRMN